MASASSVRRGNGDAVERAAYAEGDHAFEQRQKHGAAGDDGLEVLAYLPILK